MKKVYFAFCILLVVLNLLGCNLIEVSTDEVKNNQSMDEMKNAYMEIMPNFWECYRLTEAEVHEYENKFKSRFEECIKKDILGHTELDTDKAWNIRKELLGEADKISTQRVIDSFNDPYYSNKNNYKYYDPDMLLREFRGSIYEGEVKKNEN